jgi:hypothetical protein
LNPADLLLCSAAIFGRVDIMAWDFSLTEEQRMLVDTVRQFMEQEIIPHERETSASARCRRARQADPEAGGGAGALRRQHAG